VDGWSIRRPGTSNLASAYYLLSSIEGTE
jgi:hypothetical protein